ncbi:MAG TPA: hypothetical protein VGB73_20670 [Pyrinomonadaceae bacterium]|jgi:hypothetical protein
MSKSGRNLTALSFRTGIFVLGALCSFLPLISNLWKGALPILLGLLVFFVIVLVIYGLALIGDARKEEKKLNELDWLRLLTMSVAILGFGLGISVFFYRGRLKEFGSYAQSHLDSPPELFLASLVFLGLIMGFYVVRNWLKDDDDFIKSLTAVAGGAFLASILGQSAKDLGGGVNMGSSFAHYFVGFSISAFVNLLVYAYLTSRYSKTLSSSSRALIYFLYGTDKAKALDSYFLKNFEEDKNYAKRQLVNALKEFREKVLFEYANKMEQKRKRFKAGDGTSQTTAPLIFYRLIDIECETAAAADAADSPPPVKDKPVKDESYRDKNYIMKIEEIADESGGIRSDMFRMGVTIRMSDHLQYIVAAGEYRSPFPIRKSVAGLALKSGHTIVMDRDKNKQFRTEDNQEGICPSGLEAERGFDEIDYLSYVSVPVVSRIGNPEEFALGIINVDTKLFAVEESTIKKMIKDKSKEEKRKILKVSMTPNQLTTFASNLYEENDEAVKYLNDMRAIAVPLLELYLKCQQGAT